jgi:hypothetical protein
MKTILSASAALFISAAAMALSAGSANATQYLLNYDACSGGCGSTSYGTIDVTTSSGMLTVDIELNSNVIFQKAGQDPHEEIFFDTNTSTVSINGISTPFDLIGPNPQTAGSFSPNGASLGSYDYVIERDGVGNPSTASGGEHSLIFTLSGASNLALDFTQVGTKQLYFVVDVAGFTANGQTLVNTGRVGATLATQINLLGVPEPTTWAMMILGFGGVGVLLRRRRGLAIA